MDLESGTFGAREQKKLEHRIKLQSMNLKREQSKRLRKLHQILKKPINERTSDDLRLIEQSSDLLKLAETRLKKANIAKDRCLEIEDSSDELDRKCKQLASIIKKSKGLLVYTGAGISTSACIPDYRGPNGVWTQLHSTGSIKESNDIALAEPTYTHRALKTLYDQAIVKHVVSQNCDGLHLRSGLPQSALSEIHGNMYIEVCKSCKVQHFRDFDVTENTALRRHKTGRDCVNCVGDRKSLFDTIVHFGEKGQLEWPLNWEGAQTAADNADVILCLGSSLKILRKYKCLWPKHGGLKLIIVNLQWTPKDSQAMLKINGKCDEVLNRIMSRLHLEVEDYKKSTDPLRLLYTKLFPYELQTCNKMQLFLSGSVNKGKESESGTVPLLNNKTQPGWFGKGLRHRKKSR